MKTIFIMVLSLVSCISAQSFAYSGTGKCKICHNEASPSHKSFNYEERLKLIAHPYPDDMK